MCDEDVAALVVDNGSGMCKVIIIRGFLLPFLGDFSELLFFPSFMEYSMEQKKMCVQQQYQFNFNTSLGKHQLQYFTVISNLDANNSSIRKSTVF